MGYPWGVFDSRQLVRKTCHREKKVADPVDVLQERLANRLRVCQSNDQSFCSTADRSSKVQARRKLRSTWHHEVSKWLVATINLVDPAFDLADMRVADSNDLGLVAGTLGRGQVRSNVEHATLHLTQNGSYNCGFILGARARNAEPKHGIEFINRSVSVYPRMVFAHPRPGEESGRAVITGSGVKLAHWSVFGMWDPTGCEKVGLGSIFGDCW
jgi:hypothetical protein